MLYPLSYGGGRLWRTRRGPPEASMLRLAGPRLAGCCGVSLDRTHTNLGVRAGIIRYIAL
jgi:hypothetical protein